MSTVYINVRWLFLSSHVYMCCHIAHCYAEFTRTGCFLQRWKLKWKLILWSTSACAKTLASFFLPFSCSSARDRLLSLNPFPYLEEVMSLKLKTKRHKWSLEVSLFADIGCRNVKRKRKREREVGWKSKRVCKCVGMTHSVCTGLG